MQSSLEIYQTDGNLFFARQGRWLHPLFELREFLTDNPTDISGFLLKDKVIGAAAAVLIVKLGFTRCYGQLMSRKAATWLEKYQVQYDQGQLVNAIQCRTEEMIILTDSLQDNYQKLANRYQAVITSEI